MFGLALIRVLLMTALVARAVLGDSSPNEPQFPRLLNKTSPNHHRIHILSERYDSSGGYTAAEELIDVGLGKAAYIETSNNVRTTWLIDAKENTMYKYRPFNCVRSEHASLQADTPNIVELGSPKIAIDQSSHMFLFGISGLIELFSVSSVAPKYGRTANLMRTVGDLDGSNRVGHKWSLDDGRSFIQVFFSEAANTTAGHLPELLLDSIEIKRNSVTTTINILSIDRDLQPEAYNNELQLPLIYGCRRHNKLSVAMQQKYDILAVDTATRHHLKIQARAVSFASNYPSSTEATSLEIALSEPHDANYSISPVKVHMIHQDDVKTVIDHCLNVKYEANLLDGTCSISRVNTFDQVLGENWLVLQFSDGLMLNISARALDSILYNVSKESFMKLEQRGSLQYAYFADSFTNVFGAGKLGRVVRRFSFEGNEKEGATLDTVAIWLLDSTTQDLKIIEAFDLNIIERKSMAGYSNSAKAFDVSRECYLNNENMQAGRDYAWFELDYTLTVELLEQLKSKVEELKSTFYRLIRANLGLNYLRIPKMEVIFGRSGFTVRMLVLDSLPLHLIYEEFDFASLEATIVEASEIVASLHECSDFCRRHRCTGMTFSKHDKNCSITTSKIELIRQLEKSQGSVTYSIGSEMKKEFLLNDELGLAQQIGALQSTNQNVSRILGFDDFNKLYATRSPKGFSNLRVLFKLNGGLVDLAPTSSRVELDVEKPGTADASDGERP